MSRQRFNLFDILLKRKVRSSFFKTIIVTSTIYISYLTIQSNQAFNQPSEQSTSFDPFNMSTTTSSTASSASINPPINQAANPLNAPVNDTRMAHHSHSNTTSSSIDQSTGRPLDTKTGHHDTATHEKGGLMHNLFGSSDKHAADKHATDKHDKHHDNTTLTSSNAAANNATHTNHHLVDAAINTVTNRHTNTGVLSNALSNYANQLAALNQTRQRIAAAFSAVLSEQNSPYSQLAQDYSQSELSLVRNQATIPDRMVDQSYQDFDKRHGRINGLVDQLNKQRSSVDHYSEKLTKLFHDRDTATSSGKTLSTKELERLERNQVKARDAEVAYNQTNSQLIEEINYLGTAPVQQLGPALVAFISGEQMRAAQTNAALSKIVIDANTINSRADMWARSQPHVLAPMTGASHIHGLNTNLRDRSHSTSTTAAMSTSTASTSDKHHHADKHTHDKHAHDKTVTNTNTNTNVNTNTNKDVQAMTDAMGTTMIRSEEQLAVGSERVVLEEVTMHKYVTSEIINVPVTVRTEHISINRVHVHDKDRHNSLSHNDRNINTTNATATTGTTSATGVTGTNTNLNRAGVVAPTGATANTNAAVSTAPTTGLHGQNVAGSNVTGSSLNTTGTGLHGSALSNTTSKTGLDADVTGEWDFILSAEQPVITTRVVPYERIRVRKITDHSVQRISADLRKENVDFTLAPNVANQGQPEVAIRDIDPAAHRAAPGEVVECMDGNGLVNQAGSGAQQTQAGGLYNKDQSALRQGTNAGTFDKTQTQTQAQTNQQRANENRPLERV